jgi:hypothetical protein
MRQIHACKNDCILYRGDEYEDLEKCSIYRVDRFNHRKDGSDDEKCNRRNNGPKKMFCYFPIIPHLKRWFANKNELELLPWYKEMHKQDVRMIRHHDNITQWRNIDLQNYEFIIDPRNIRIAMITDGMNPFMINNTHNT